MSAKLWKTASEFAVLLTNTSLLLGLRACLNSLTFSLRRQRTRRICYTVLPLGVGGAWLIRHNNGNVTDFFFCITSSCYNRIGSL